MFALWLENEVKERYLSIAEQKLARWDDKLRFLSSAKRYLYKGEKLSTLTRLVKSIEIYRREERGSNELLTLATSEHATQLTHLSIVRSEISSKAWQALVESSYLWNLQHLHVRKTVLGHEDIRRLFQSTCLRRLQCLKLIDVGLRRQWLDAAGQSIPFPEMHGIDFSNNILSDDVVLFLAQAPG